MRFGSVTLLVLIVAALPARAADDSSIARGHYVAGTRAYDLGHYDEAVREYELAYRAKDDPALLFNIGQAYRAAADPANAIRAFRSYLRRVPDANNRAEVEEKVTQLQHALDERDKAVSKPEQRAPEPPAPAPTAEVRKPSRRAMSRLEQSGIGLLVGGVACLGVGGAFVGLGRSATDDVNHPKNGVYDPSALDRRNLFQSLDVSFFVVGGVSVATGALLLVFGHRTRSRQVVASSQGTM